MRPDVSFLGPLFLLYLLYYRALPLKIPTLTMLDDLHDHCAPSHFGHGKELVKDEFYRLARELEAERFGLNFDPIAQRTGVVATVSAFVKKGVDVRMYKLNSYTTSTRSVFHSFSWRD